MIVPKPRSATLPIAITLRKLLLVEGETPAHFFEALARHLSIADKIEIRSFGGKEQLASFLKLLVTTSDFQSKVTSLGIVRDAEEDAKAARSSVLDAVRAASIPPIVRVSHFILPDNTTPGMIETLCVKSIEGQSVHQCVRDFIACAEGAGAVFPTGIIIAKHYIQVYLATQPAAQMMPGIASYRGAWAWDHTAFDDLRKFLCDL
jgi:hypothetical protein